MKLILARKILPVSSPPVSNGAICINDGAIVELGSRSRLLASYPKAKVSDLGNMLVMPGLVNAHTHLELSHLKGLIGETRNFFDWIQRVINLRGGAGADDIAKAATAALRDAAASGTTCVGDISSTESAVPCIVKSGIRAVVFLEVIGLDNSAAEGSFRRFKTRADSLKGLPDRITTGVSPHSTYSVSSSLYNKMAKHISDNGIHMAVHISETKDEMLHIKGRPSGMDGYMLMVGWDSHRKNRADTPLGFLGRMGLHDNLLAVHAVHVTTGDIKLMATHRISVAHCPRSNHMLSTGRAPVGRMLSSGVNVALGTDSLASNLDLDMWEEMRFAYLVNNLPAEEIVRMATLSGAKALGLEAVTGSLEPGKAADLIAVRGSAAHSAEPCLPLLRDTRAADVMLTMVGGRVVHRSRELRH